MTAPEATPRFRDHLSVLGLLLAAPLALIPHLLVLPVCWAFGPFMRWRFRRLLARPEAVAPATEPPPIDADAWSGKTIFLLVGEASGDELIAPVVGELAVRVPGLRIRGYGGPATRAAGMHVDRDLTAHAVMGLVAVVRSLGFWWSVIAQTLARWREAPPDLVVGVDFPGLNKRLLRLARRRGLGTVHVVAPQVWAHNTWLVYQWRRAAQRILSLLPFEPTWFARYGIDCRYVGHPLFEAPLAAPRSPAALPASGPVCVELLPGSRAREIAGNAPVLLAAAAELETHHAGVEFQVRLARAGDAPRFEAARARALRVPQRLTVAVGSPQAGAAPVVAALACSGTVTAELGAALVPMVVCYRVPWIARLAAFLFLTTPWFSLVNLVAGRGVAPERFTAGPRDGRRLAGDLRPLLTDPEAYSAQRAALEPVRARLERPTVAAHMAGWIMAEPDRRP